MKRPSWKTALWFCLPFVILAGMAWLSRRALQLPKNNGFFAAEVKQRIPVGMPLRQAKELLRGNGFETGHYVQTIALGRPATAVKFTRMQNDFPRFLNKNGWEVDLWVKNGRVAHAQGGYYYSRWD